MPIDAQTLSHLVVVNDLRHAADDALKRRHKLPALILYYSFIDICSVLADEMPGRQNNERFMRFVETYGIKINDVTSHELWAARSSIVHTFSPIGNHTNRPDKSRENSSVRPLFYYCWPETKETTEGMLRASGYTDFAILNVTDIKWLAVHIHNGLWAKLENDPTFCEAFKVNAQHLLKDAFQLGLQFELAALDALKATQGILPPKETSR